MSPSRKNHESIVDDIFLAGGGYATIICNPFQQAENWFDALHCLRCHPCFRYAKWHRHPERPPTKVTESELVERIDRQSMPRL